MICCLCKSDTQINLAGWEGSGMEGKGEAGEGAWDSWLLGGQRGVWKGSR